MSKKPNQQEHVDASTARKGEYRKLIEKIARDGVCPFCPENFVYHPKPILHRVGNWLITENIKPYPNALHHFLLVGNEHKVSIGEMTAEDWSSIQKLIAWAESEFGITGGAFAMRHGDNRYTGASVTHLHAHYIVADAERPRSVWEKLATRFGKSQAVEFPIGRREGYK